MFAIYVPIVIVGFVLFLLAIRWSRSRRVDRVGRGEALSIEDPPT